METSGPPPESDANPELVFTTLNAFQRSAALHGAIQLDLFTAVGQAGADAGQLAERCQTDRRGTRILCDYLVVIGFLTKSDQRYHLTATSAEFLDRQSPQYLGSIARFINGPQMHQAFRDVAQLVRQGTTLLEGRGTVESEYAGWIEFAQSMAPIMMPAAHFMAQMAEERLSGPIRVLDIAAGHGMFGITVAQRLPEARIVALDWEKVLEVAAVNADRAGVGSRYSCLPGDALQRDYGGPYDLVLVTNFLHHFDHPTCQQVMGKITRALSSSGLVMTLEFVPNPDRVSPPVPAMFSLTMLGTTPSGDAYTFAEYQAMWESVGLSHHQLLDVPHSAQRLIVSTR